MVEIKCKCGASWEFDGDSECPNCHTDNETTYNPEVEGGDIPRQTYLQQKRKIE